MFRRKASSKARFCFCFKRPRASGRDLNKTDRHVIDESSYVMRLQLKGNWNEIKGKLKQKYGQLTDQDLTFAEGKDDELLGRLQKRLGRSKDELRSEIEKL
jgi:uncharacterized protein YjbJ (UPF0337 family)